MKLSQLKVHQYALILSVSIPKKKLKKRLLELGIVPETFIKVVKIAPLKDPISIEIRGYELCISRKIASYILVEVIR